MLDFQAAERQRLQEPASDIGLEPICAMVCGVFTSHLVFLNLLYHNLMYHVFCLVPYQQPPVP